MAIKKLYEATFIVNAALEDQDIDAVVSKVASYIENNGGTIKELQKWGRKRLAYPINKKYNGYYVHVIMEASPNVLPIYERFFVLDDTILRHLILQIENDLLELRANKALLEGRALAEAEALAKEEVLETAK